MEERKRKNKEGKDRKKQGNTKGRKGKEDT